MNDLDKSSPIPSAWSSYRSATRTSWYLEIRHLSQWFEFCLRRSRRDCSVMCSYTWPPPGPRGGQVPAHIEPNIEWWRRRTVYCIISTSYFRRIGLVVTGPGLQYKGRRLTGACCSVQINVLSSRQTDSESCAWLAIAPLSTDACVSADWSLMKSNRSYLRVQASLVDGQTTRRGWRY